MLKRPRRELFTLVESDDEDDDESTLKQPKTIRYSKILEEENDFWPEENFHR